MNKSELQEILSKELNLPMQTASGIINTILDSMTNTLVNDENVELRGFGSFSVRHYDSYVGRNPKAREKTIVKEKNSLFLRSVRN